MKTLKKISYIFVVLALIGLTAFKLVANKKEMKADAEMAKQNPQVIPVIVEKAKTETLDKNIEATGTFLAHKDLAVISETQGRIIRVYKQKGDLVNKGTVIAKVDDELLAAQAIVVEANFKKMEKDLKRFENLASGNAITKRQLEEARLGYKKAKSDLITVKRRLSDTQIKAPISGKINDDFIEEGLVIGGGMKICEIVDIQKLKINVELSEKEVLNVEENLEVVVSPNVYSEVKMTGIVKSVSQKSTKGMKYKVEIELNNSKENPIKAGMYANVEFPSIRKSNGLFIKRKAIIGSVKNPQVFVAQNNKAILKNIKIGKRIGDKLEVLSGLKEGEQVVVSGQLNLKNNTKIRVQ